MAVIEKRSNSRYRAKTRKKGVSKSKTFDTKRQAQSWANIEEAKITSGKMVVETNKTIEDVLKKYAGAYGKNKKHINDLNKIARHSIGSKLLKYLTTSDCQNWINKRLTQVKPNSVLREISTLNPVLEYCRKIEKYIDENHLTDTTRPKAGKPRVRRCSEEEISVILDALQYTESDHAKCERDEITVSFLLALETAMRQGELWNIEWKDVSWEGKYVHLPETKNGSARDVPLTTRAIELFGKLKQNPRPFNHPQYSCGKIFANAVTLAGVLDFTFHDTRHEAITRLARKLEMLDLARMVGHKDPRSLMIYYNATASEIADRLG